MRVRRQLLLRYCTACRETTEQARLGNDDLWRCRRCGAELTEIKWTAVDKERTK